MAIKFNNTDLSDIVFNGTNLDKVYFNNVLVFEKVLSQIYRRRIMVGDNLAGKDIYNTFPVNFYSKLQLVDDETSYPSYPITGSNFVIDHFIWMGSSDDDWGAVVETDMSSSNYGTFYLRNPDSNEENTNPIKVNSTEDYIVTNINDDIVYRDLYIEDKNIRPIQVGDKIGPNTKVYFNIPDEDDFGWDYLFAFGGYGMTIVAGKTSTLKTFYIKGSSHYIDGNYDVLNQKLTLVIGSKSIDIFDANYTPETNTRVINKNISILKDFISESITINDIYTDGDFGMDYSGVLNCILVDTTTLEN